MQFFFWQEEFAKAVQATGDRQTPNVAKAVVGYFVAQRHARRQRKLLLADKGRDAPLTVQQQLDAENSSMAEQLAQLKRDATKHLPKGPAAAAGTQLDVQGPGGGTERINVANDQARLEAFRRNEGQKRRH